MSNLVWFDGKITKTYNEISVPLLSQGLHYGFGAFEGIRTRKYAEGSFIFRLTDHIQRLYHSTSKLFYQIEDKFTPQEIEQACQDVLTYNQLRETYIQEYATTPPSERTMAIINPLTQNHRKDIMINCTYLRNCNNTHTHTKSGRNQTTERCGSSEKKFTTAILPEIHMNNLRTLKTKTSTLQQSRYQNVSIRHGWS